MPLTPCHVAVFGSSEPREGDPDFQRALELGRALGRAGFAVVTGGYGGVMEAASRGAREAGAATVGVTCEIFDARAPNAWLDTVIATPDLHERTRELIRRADAFVILPGKAGTLAELALLWALHRAGCLGPRPVVLLGGKWERLLDCLRGDDLLDPPEYTMTDIAQTPEQAVHLVAQRLRAQPPERLR